MQPLVVRVDGRILLGLAGLAGFCLVFNLAYSLQRSMRGAMALPMWLLIIDVCLVATVMYDRKMKLIGGLMVAAYLIEWLRWRALHPTDLAGHLFEYLLWTTLLYFPTLLFLTIFLFVRLDHIAHPIGELEAQLAPLVEDATRMMAAIGEAQRQARQEEASARAGGMGPPNHELYRRAVSGLVAQGSPDEILTFLARTLRDGYGIVRACLLVPGPGGPPVIKESWGGRPDVPVSTGLLAPVTHQLVPLDGAALDKARRDEGEIRAFEAEAFPLEGIYPLVAGRTLRAALVVGATGGRLRAIPLKTVMDLAGLALERLALDR